MAQRPGRFALLRQRVGILGVLYLPYLLSLLIDTLLSLLIDTRNPTATPRSPGGLVLQRRRPGTPRSPHATPRNPLATPRSLEASLSGLLLRRGIHLQRCGILGGLVL